MAIAVRGYYEVSNWFATGTSNDVTGVAWESGDVIVVAQYVSDGNASTQISAPTNANLTFTSRQDTVMANNEAQVRISTAVAGSTQTGQTITSGRTGITNANGAAVWVLSGADAYRGGWQNRNESATSYTPLADSAIVYFHADWLAAGGALTQTTNTGTRTERVDQNNASWGSLYSGEWVGVSAGASSHGVTSYAGLQIAQAGVEITAAAGGTTGTGTPTLTRHAGAGSGSTTAPGGTGSGAPTLARHTATGSGSTTAPSGSYVWAGTTPTDAADASAYELGTDFTVGAGGADIAGFRIWNPGNGVTVASRVIRLWNSGGQVSDGTFPFLILETMASGWNEFPLPATYTLAAGDYTMSWATGSSASDYGSAGVIGSPAAVNNVTLTRGAFNVVTSLRPNAQFPAGTPAQASYYGGDILTGAVGGSATGSGSPSLARSTAAGSGSTGPAPVSGTGSLTLARHSGAGSGTHTPPGGTGSGSPSLVRATGAGSGSTAPPSITGSGSPTLARHAGSGSGSGSSTFPTVEAENNLTGATLPSITSYGDASNQGYSDEMSVDAGGTINFKINGNSTRTDIYRLGYYGGDNARLVQTLTYTATPSQANETTITSSNGATTLSWTTTASWSVPSNALSGLYVAFVRNAALTNGSYIPFVVRNDSRVADIVVGIPTATWGLAYNHYGGPSAGITNGKNLYGSATYIGTITDRAYAVSANRPIISRGGVQNHWDDYDWGLIDYLEESGFDVKYVASHDLDRDAASFNDALVYISVGHDEYWSQGMRDNVEAFRDAGGHCLFMSANEVFWRVRWTDSYRTMWCYKDTMPGPGGHTAGDALDPVSWTGTWRDTRWGSRNPESNLTGTFFRMNGLNWETVTVVAATYGDSPFWRSTTVNTGPTNLTVASLIGFEADELSIPGSYGRATLATTTVNIDGNYANDDGQTYTNNGDLNWGVVMTQNVPTSGVVVGFGTMAWCNALSSVHDSDSTYPAETAIIRQATANLLYDLGATATSLAVATTPTPVTDVIIDYGVDVPISAGGIWEGADPSSATDANDYELGTEFTVGAGGADIIGVRIWNPGLYTQINRDVQLWSGGSSVSNSTWPYDIPDLLDTGWNEFVFPAPYTLAAGTYTISYPVNGTSANDYGNIAFVASSGGNITLNRGLFNDTQSLEPTSQFGTPFYGLDLLIGVTGPSGSGSPSLIRHVASGSGSTAVPGSAGSGAPSLARHTGAGSGSTAASGTPGSGSPSLVRHTGSGAGSTVAPPASGSGAPSLTRHATSGSGSTAAAPGSGSGAPALQRRTASGSGLTGAPPGAGAPVLNRHAAAGVGVAALPVLTPTGSVRVVLSSAALRVTVEGPGMKLYLRP